jgi:hypothetical protein
MRSVFRYKLNFSYLIRLSIVIFLTASAIFLYLLPASAQEEGNASGDYQQVFESSGKRSENYYPFAGGGSCCGCGTRHFGVLPDNFEERNIESVTFFLLTSRSDSHYQHIAVGSNKLKLTLTDNDPLSKKSYSVIAYSMELDNDHKFPITIDVSWYITFEFEEVINGVGPGWEWKLDDGDNNLLSAVWLHMSDIDDQGLPGTAETYGCQYDEKRPAHYSVMFSGTKGQTPAPSPPSPSPPSPGPTPSDILIQAEDYDSSKDFNIINNGTIAQSTDKNAELSYDFNVPKAACYVMQMRLKLSENIISVSVDGNQKHRGEIPAHDQLSGNPYKLSTWDTWDIGLGTLTAGNHTLKVKAVSYRHGGQEFDWYKISEIQWSNVPLSPVRLPSTYHEQEQDYSCFAAVAHSFILDYGGKNMSEIDFCIDTFGQTKGRTFYKVGLIDTLWFFDNYEKGLEKHSSLTLTRDDTITWDEIIDSIDKGKPIIASIKYDYFIPGSSGTHCVQIMGYGRQKSPGCSDWQRAYILNPSDTSTNPYTNNPKFGVEKWHYILQNDIDVQLYKAWRVE